MKRNFYDTSFVTLSGIRGQVPRILKYVIENRDKVLSEYELTSLAQSIRTVLKNPMADLFNRIAATEQLGNFAAIYSKDSGNDLPEVAASQNITLDLKYLNESNVLATVPELNNKVMLNITPMVKKEKYEDKLIITAADTFMNSICRGHLVASYHDAEQWLTPALNVFIVKTYSMTMAGAITRYFNLNVTENLTVAGVFALYMCQMLDGNKVDYFPALFNKCTWLGNRADIENIAEACKEVSSKGLTLADTCSLVAELGPEKLKKFDVRTLKVLAGNLGSDVITTYIAMEYPPYWVYLLLQAFSGVKIPLAYTLNAAKLKLEGTTKFVPMLLAHEELFNIHRK